MQPSAKQLAEIFAYLPEHDQKTLFEFAEFLKSRAPVPVSEILDPVEIPRPEKESVVSAIKRLAETYPMVDRKHLLNETSDLMMQHMLKGRAADTIIDELEVLFVEKYEIIIQSKQ